MRYSFIRPGCFFSHKQPLNLCNNKSESFSISFHLRPFIVIGHSSFSATCFTWRCSIPSPITSFGFSFSSLVFFPLSSLFYVFFRRALVLSAFRFVFGTGLTFSGLVFLLFLSGGLTFAGFQNLLCGFLTSLGRCCGPPGLLQVSPGSARSGHCGLAGLLPALGLTGLCLAPLRSGRAAGCSG